MQESETAVLPKQRRSLKIWVRFGFIIWATFVMSWLANSLRTQNVDDALLQSSQTIKVVGDDNALRFLPAASNRSALIFFCGSGVAAEAYAPLLKPIAEQGYAIFIVKLPYRFAPFESHKEQAIARALSIIATQQTFKRWVVAGHSLGGALAAKMALTHADALAGLVLLGTTHPKAQSLSFLRIPVTKVYATNDGIAPSARVLANRALLPAHTRWVEIPGGNHSQFGRYGHQLFDGTASISRVEQEQQVRTALLEALRSVEQAAR